MLRVVDSVFAKPNECDSDADEEDSYPAPTGDALTKKDNSPQRARRVA